MENQNKVISPQDETIGKIYEIIRWLENNGRSQAVTEIVLRLDALAIQSMYFSESVSEAYTARANAEEEYKHAVAKFIATSTESAAKSERQAVVEFTTLRHEFNQWDSLYTGLKLKLNRIDVIIDTHRQRVSLLKQIDLKGV